MLEGFCETTDGPLQKIQCTPARRSVDRCERTKDQCVKAQGPLWKQPKDPYGKTVGLLQKSQSAEGHYQRATTALIQLWFEDSGTSYETPPRSVTHPLMWGVLYEARVQIPYVFWHSKVFFSYNLVICLYMKRSCDFSLDYRLKFDKALWLFRLLHIEVCALKFTFNKLLIFLSISPHCLICSTLCTTWCDLSIFFVFEAEVLIVVWSGLYYDVLYKVPVYIEKRPGLQILKIWRALLTSVFEKTCICHSLLLVTILFVLYCARN